MSLESTYGLLYSTISTLWQANYVNVSNKAVPIQSLTLTGNDTMYTFLPGENIVSWNEYVQLNTRLEEEATRIVSTYNFNLNSRRFRQYPNMPNYSLVSAYSIKSPRIQQLEGEATRGNGLINFAELLLQGQQVILSLQTDIWLITSYTPSASVNVKLPFDVKWFITRHDERLTLETFLKLSP